MKLLVYSLLIFICLQGNAQSSNTITIGNAASIYSNILHEKRKVWVSMPDTTSPDGIFYPQRYPVVYLLDADETHFAQVAVMLRKLGGGSGNLSFPQMILVGIPNTDRTRDLSPTHVASSPALDSFSAAHSGGGENFLAFIEKELIPHIDAAYPAAPYRVLIGHSLGGLMAVYAMVNHPNLFNGYLAIDPSLWWDNQAILKQAENALSNIAENKSLFIAIANTMQQGMDTAQVQHDTAFNSLHIRSILQLVHTIKPGTQSKLQFGYKYYGDYGHDGVELLGEYDGLQALFAFYGYAFPYGEFFNPQYKGDTLLAAHYKSVSKRMGYTVTPPEQFISAVAHQLIDMKQFERAYYFLQMNINNYPNSAISYSNMGHYYVEKADKQKAIAFYKKSLSLRHDADVQNALTKLEQSK